LSNAAEAHPALAMPARLKDVPRSRISVEHTTRRDRMMYEFPLFLLASGVIALSFLLPTLQSRHAWINIPCIFNKVTGLPCLACGLTRSFVFTAHGNLYRAFEMHLLGPGLFVLTCGAAVYLASELAIGRRIRFRLATRTRRIAFWSVLGLFLVCWGIKLAFIKGGW
jgi:hypothetical protein